MFNLQSTTIQINSHDNGKAPTQAQPPHHSVPHHQVGLHHILLSEPLSFLLNKNMTISPQARSGLMREVSTELEKKLESRQKDRPITVTSTSHVPNIVSFFCKKKPAKPNLSQFRYPPERAEHLPPRPVQFPRQPLPGSRSTRWRRSSRWRRGSRGAASAPRGEIERLY